VVFRRYGSPWQLMGSLGEPTNPQEPEML